MGIDVMQEELFSITEATKILPRRNGKRAAICTVWRWCRRGIKGVHLEYVRLGRNIYTSGAALNRFAANLAARDLVIEAENKARAEATAACIEAKFPKASQASREASIRRAEEILEKAGILNKPGT